MEIALPITFIRVKNWDEYQHYKDRSAPWIKLHKELLSSHFWVMGSDASKLLAICIMLLAQRTDNKIPMDNEYIKRFGHLESTPDLQPLIDFQLIEFIDESELLQDASIVLASCYPEERERRIDNTLSESDNSRVVSFEKFWKAYPKKSGKGAAETAWKKIKKPTETVELILVSLEWQKKSTQWIKDNGQFIPNPATYLNQRRWEDQNDDKNESSVMTKEEKTHAWMMKMNGLSS